MSLILLKEDPAVDVKSAVDLVLLRMALSAFGLDWVNLTRTRPDLDPQMDLLTDD